MPLGINAASLELGVCLLGQSPLSLDYFGCVVSFAVYFLSIINAPKDLGGSVYVYLEGLI